MHLRSYRLRNYRRLKNVHIELAEDVSIFVGSNNSGKTSATQAIQAFLSGAKDRFSLYDFSTAVWNVLDKAGDLDLDGPIPDNYSLPSIDLDLWFEVAAPDLYLVIPLLPSTAWEVTKVGIRVALTARNSLDLISNYQTAKTKSAEQVSAMPAESDYEPWPRSLTDYLQRELKSEYEFHYFILDRAGFDENFCEIGDYLPSQLGGEPGGGAILKSLIVIDNLGAQRHLSDPSSDGAGGRYEDLSKRLSRFYKRNLNQKQDDHSALKALSDSEKALNIHLDDVFKAYARPAGQTRLPGSQQSPLEDHVRIGPSARNEPGCARPLPNGRR